MCVFECVQLFFLSLHGVETILVVDQHLFNVVRKPKPNHVTHYCQAAVQTSATSPAVKGSHSFTFSGDTYTQAREKARFTSTTRLVHTAGKDICVKRRRIQRKSVLFQG